MTGGAAWRTGSTAVGGGGGANPVLPKHSLADNNGVASKLSVDAANTNFFIVNNVASFLNTRVGPYFSRSAGKIISIQTHYKGCPALRSQCAKMFGCQ